jgi:tRNA pseudouridine13 synthase
MKIKQKPSDFIVKENIDLELNEKYTRSFTYSIYLMKKENLDTGNALKLLSRKLRVRGEEIKLSGLKDKLAITSQYVSIKGKHPRNVVCKGLELVLKGYSQFPLHIGMHKSNTFKVLISDLTPQQIKNIKLKKKMIIPNYFGDQRFGSVKFFNDSDDFIAKKILQRHYWEALKIFLTKFTPDDEQKEIKKKIKQYWESLKDLNLSPGLYRTIVEVLAATNNPLQAMKKIPSRVLKLAIYAYQSYLWNETMKEYIKSNFEDYKTLKSVCGPLYFPNITKVEDFKIPILNYKSKIPDEVKDAVDIVLNKEEFEQKDLRTKTFKDSFFSTSLRPAFVEAKNFSYRENKHGVVVEFTLPKGAYATVVVDWLVL